MTVGERPKRSPGITYDEILDNDTRPVPACLREQSTADFGEQDVPVRYYVSREVHEQEKVKLWPRVWQFACREEHLPEVGDTYVYEIVDTSILLVRVAPDKIKAYFNACLHRGRALRDGPGWVSELRCPFHGFCWSLDGTLKHVPSAWDFPQIRADEFQLVEARVGTWGGFVFVNMDLDAQPLEDFLGVLPAHFADWRLEERWTAVHVAKRIRANWKVAQEAFCEALHVAGTHPQLLPVLGDTNSRCDVWGNVSRVITPNGTPSPNLSWTPTEQEMLDAMVDRRVDEEPRFLVPDGMTARQFTAEAGRAELRSVLGDAADQLSDAELNDALDYTVFPNFHPWGAYNRIVYRFRPNGDDHVTCIMECLFITPFAGERPPPAKVHWLDFDEPWTAADELGSLARVFEQDSFNMSRVQAGLTTTRKAGVTLSVYQEVKLRQFYALFEEHLGRNA
jgi:phenylpropionate dioxygenase-like ring-hydroxylating dioxygenase large terminal subunit